MFHRFWWEPNKYLISDLRTYFGLCRVCKFETIFLCRVCKLETIFLTWLNLWFWDLTLKLKWTFIFKSFYKVLLHQHNYNPNQVPGQEQTNKIIDTIILHMTWFIKILIFTGTMSLKEWVVHWIVDMKIIIYLLCWRAIL